MSLILYPLVKSVQTRETTKQVGEIGLEVILQSSFIPPLSLTLFFLLIMVPACSDAKKPVRRLGGVQEQDRNGDGMN